MRKTNIKEETKQKIIAMFSTGKYSQRELGKIFNISHSTVSYILNPEKKEIIKLYHKKYWENNKTEIKNKHKLYYQNNKKLVNQINSEYYKTHKEEMSLWQRKYDYKHKCGFLYVKENEKENIENYELAKKDNFKGWVIHHRLETHNSDGLLRKYEITPDELKGLKMYLKRPATELIFLTRNQHRALHNHFLNKGNILRCGL